MDVGAGSHLEVRLLGDLVVSVGGEHVRIIGAQQRALMTVLALHANQVLSPERLIDALWGPAPPATAAASLRVSVSKLRRALEASGVRDALVTRPGGYVLELVPGQSDIDRFEWEIQQARTASDPLERAAALDRALTLWRGPTVEGVDHDAATIAELARLEALHDLAVEDRIDRRLELGEHREVIPELQTLVAANPLRERCHGQLMVALSRSGRQVEALEVYRRLRDRLVEDVGLEPGADLRALERSILQQDQATVAEPTAPPPAAGRAESAPGSRRAWRVWMGGAAALLLAATAALMYSSRDQPEATDLGSVARLDVRSGAVIGEVPIDARIHVGDGFGPIVVGDDVWVMNTIDHTLSQVDVDRATVTATIPLGADPVDVTVADGDVWATIGAENTVVRVDGATGEVLATLPVGELPVGVTEAAGDIWVANHRGRPTGSVWRIDPQTNRVIAKIPVGARSYRSGPSWLAASAGSVWVGVSNLNAVVRIDTSSNEVVATIPVSDGGVCGPITAETDAVWVAAGLCGNGALTEIDPASNAVVARIRSPHWHSVFGAVRGFGSLWVSTDGGPFQIDPETHEVLGRLAVPGDVVFGGDLAVGAGSLWIHDAGTQSVIRLAVPQRALPTAAASSPR